MPEFMSAKSIFTLTLCAVVLFFSGCGSQSGANAGVLKIAVIAPFSGDYEMLGQSTRNGVVLAVEEWNQRGGVLGNVAQVVLLDSRCDYDTARQVAQEAVDEHDVQFIIGAVCSAASEGVAQVAMESGVLQISPTSVDPEITLDFEGGVRWLVFRVPVVDPVQGAVAAQFALQELAVERASILYAENSGYGRSLANAFQETFRAGGGEIVSLDTYNQDDELFYDALDNVRDAEPDIIYAPGYYDVANRLVLQARSFGLFQTFIGSDGWDAPDLNVQSVDGSYFTTHDLATDPRPEVRQWIQRYEARYIVRPDVVATFGYDAANILLSAIQEAGSTVPVAVADTMMLMTFDAVSGEMTFGEDHNPVKSMPVVQVRNGQLFYVDRFSP